MKGVWMGWAKTGLAGIVVVASVAGCQNKMYDQNKELVEENRQLRDQNDAMRKQTAQQTPPPQVQQQTMAQPQSPPPQSATNPQVAQANRQPVEQIGGLE